MANNILPSQSGNALVINSRREEFVNATAMCSLQGKEVKDWFHSSVTYSICTKLAISHQVNNSNKTPSKKDRLSVTEYAIIFPNLVWIKRGSPENGGGVWIHPVLASYLKQWLEKLRHHKKNRGRNHRPTCIVRGRNQRSTCARR